MISVVIGRGPALLKYHSTEIFPSRGEAEGGNELLNEDIYPRYQKRSVVKNKAPTIPIGEHYFCHFLAKKTQQSLGELNSNILVSGNFIHYFVTFCLGMEISRH